MANRLDFHEILCNILGSRNAYFDPPESVKLSYPAIVYSLSQIKSNHADNIPYFKVPGYTVIVIDTNKDSIISDKVSNLPNCKFDRAYSKNGLNYFVYTLYNQGGKSNGA